MARIELTPMNQQMLEKRYHDKVRECNANIRKAKKTYEDWYSASEAIRSRYTREEYKVEFVDFWREQRRYWVERLHQVRKGYILE